MKGIPLLPLVAAAAFGSAATLAIRSDRSAPAGPPASVVEVPLVSPTPWLPAADPLPSELAEKIFDGYHARVVSEFVNRKGFGFTRTAPHPGFSPYLDSSFTRFDFTFIGNDPAIRKFEPKDPALKDWPLVFRIRDAYDLREKERNAVMLKEIDPFQRAPVYDPGALFDKDLKPAVSLPTAAEFAILARFEASPETNIELHPVDGGTLGYGAVRAAASCLQCHEKGEGALLGLFRYRFEHGPAASLEDLALR